MPRVKPGHDAKNVRRRRRLGNSDLHLAPLMLGGNVFGWTIDEKTSFGILDAFVDAGFNAVDTSDSYARWIPGSPGGESETIIGNWLKRSGKRDKVLIATKVGEDMGEGRSLKKDYILRECETSLRRLQTDHIDLYQTHFDDEVTPVEETMQAYAALIKAGKVRAIGASNISPARLKASLAASKQPWSAALREPAAALQPLRPQGIRDRVRADLPRAQARRHQLLFARRRISSPANTARPRKAPNTPDEAAGSSVISMRAGSAFSKSLDDVAARHNALQAQIALAWLIARPIITAPIVSATSLKQLGEIMKAPAIKLSPGDIAALDAAGA